MNGQGESADQTPAKDFRRSAWPNELDWHKPERSRRAQQCLYIDWRPKKSQAFESLRNQEETSRAWFSINNDQHKKCGNVLSKNLSPMDITIGGSIHGRQIIVKADNPALPTLMRKKTLWMSSIKEREIRLNDTIADGNSLSNWAKKANSEANVTSPTLTIHDCNKAKGKQVQNQSEAKN